MAWLAWPALIWAIPYLAGVVSARSVHRRRVLAGLELVAILVAVAFAVAVFGRGVPARDAVVAIVAAVGGLAAIAALCFTAGASPRRWWTTAAGGMATLVVTFPSVVILAWFVVSFATCEAADSSACPNS